MNSREASFKILLNFEQTKNRLEDIINNIFKLQEFSLKEKKTIYNTCSGVIRNLSLLDWKIGMLFRGNYKKSLNKFKVIMRLALFEIDFLDFIPSFATVNEYVDMAKRKLDKRSGSIVNGILRTYLREQGKFKPEKKFKFIDTQISVKYSFPEWMVKNWVESFGENETEELCRAFNERPIFDVRVNNKKITNEEFQQILESNNIDYVKSDYLPQIVKVTDIQKINQLKLFEKGLCSIQDESALLVTEMLDIENGETILDACSAPGGKFTAILEKNYSDVLLIGTDIYFDRLSVIKQNCSRLGFDNFYLLQSDSVNPPFKQKFDKILLDAPCSGSGTIQKSPDIKWRRKQPEIIEFQKLQLRLLKSVSKFLKPGGSLVYSTCSVNIEENEQVIGKFLVDNADFSIIPPKHIFKKFATAENFLRTFPHIHKMDGSFAAVLKKDL